MEKQNTARWVEDDVINSQEINNSKDLNGINSNYKFYGASSPDIINPYSEYAKGFYDGLIQEQQKIVQIIADEIKNEKFAKEREVLRNWTWEDELMLILSKILNSEEKKEE